MAPVELRCGVDEATQWGSTVVSFDSFTLRNFVSEVFVNMFDMFCLKMLQITHNGLETPLDPGLCFLCFDISPFVFCVALLSKAKSNGPVVFNPVKWQCRLL